MIKPLAASRRNLARLISTGVIATAALLPQAVWATSTDAPSPGPSGAPKDSSAYSSTLQLTTGTESQANAQQAGQSFLDGLGGSVAPEYQAPPGGGGGSCGYLPNYTSKRFSDSDGTFTAEFYPNYNQIRWTYRLASALWPTASGPVFEEGLGYFINGSNTLHKNAPHTEPISYLFHGTMSGVGKSSLVDYLDYYTWSYEGLGTVQVSIGGCLTTQ